MLFEGQEHFSAEVTAFLAELIVHPEALPANVNPTAPFQVGQVAGHGGLGQLEHGHQVANAQFAFSLQ